MPDADTFADQLASQAPGPGILDYSGSLTDQQKQQLQAQCSQLSFKARVVILPKDYTVSNPVSFGEQLAKKWHCERNSVLMIVDLKDRGVFAWSGTKLSRAGLSEQTVSNQLIPNYFAPTLKSQGLGQAIEATLSAADKIVVQSKAATYASSQSNYSSGSSSGSSSNYSSGSSDSASYAGFIFLFLFLVIVCIIYFNGKAGKRPTKKMDRAKERAKFKGLMQELEALAETAPSKYFAKVAALAILGYAYVWFALACLCILSLFTLLLLAKLPFLAIKLGLPLLALIGVILRSFWLKIEPVQGIELSRKSYPDIYALVETIRHAIKAPRVDTILVVPDLNAAVTQRPRLGLLGWQKNYLLIGMPLAQSLTYDQFESVLAHELGHLAGGHTAGTAWIYNVRAVWSQLLETLYRNRSIGTLLFTRFFNWYTPYFDAYSFSLARRQERHADKCSIDLSGAETAAVALLAVGVKARYMQRRYWKSVLETIKDSAEPPRDVYTRFTNNIADGIDENDARTWLHDDLEQKTDFRDTHPAKRDRVSAILNIDPEQVPDWAEQHLDEIIKVEEPAAKALFGKMLPTLLAQLDTEWLTQVRPAWVEDHNSAIFIRGELSKLEEKAASAELSEEELVMLASRTAQVRGFATAEPIFKRALAQMPGHAGLLHVYGLWLLDEQDPDGVAHLERAMELDNNLGVSCCEKLYSYMKTKGREEESEKYADLHEQYMRAMSEALNERSTVSAEDHYTDHDLDDDKLRELIALISNQKELKQAILVKKDVVHNPDKPLYVMMVDFKQKMMGKSATDQQLVSALARIGTYPVSILIVSRVSAPVRLRNYIKDTHQEPIFKR
jgi:Zn-dependent protease with chaperone function